MFKQCFFYYHGLKLFRDKIKRGLDECDGSNPKHDELFVTIFDAISKREWQAVHQMESITFQFVSDANNEAQTKRVMASWIVFI